MHVLNQNVHNVNIRRNERKKKKNGIRQKLIYEMSLF